MNKCVVVTLLFAFFQVSKSQDSENEAELCLKKLSLERDKIENILNDERNAIPEDNIDLNQFAACYLQKMGYQEPDGKVNLHLLVEPIVEKYAIKSNAENQNQKIGEKAVKACKDVPSGSSKGQTAIKVFNCLTKNVKELTQQAS